MRRAKCRAMSQQAVQPRPAGEAFAGPALVAWTPFPGKSLLERLGPDRAQFRRTPAWEGEAPDLIVFPYPYSTELDRLEEGLQLLRRQMDPALRQAVASGRTRLLFDASAEGEEHHPHLTK